MHYFNLVLNKILTILISPFQSLDPLWPLLFISVLTGILMLLAFSYTSNQENIKKEKDKIKAHLMEMSIFKDDLAILMSAFMNVLLYNARYMKHLIKPTLFLILPMIFILIHLNLWFGYRPLKTGETAVLSVRLSDQKTVALSNVTIEVDNGIAMETPSVKILESNEVDWRIRAKEAGTHTITIKYSGDTFHKRLVVSEKQAGWVSPRKLISNLWDTALNPGEKPFSKDSPVKEISINYPSYQIDFFGWKTHWLVVFCIVSLLTGFAFKGVFNVEI